MFDFLLAFPTFCDDEGAGGEAAGGEQQTEGEGGGENQEVDLSKKTFTQDELNSILNREKKKVEEKTKETIRQLEELKKSKSMTEQDRAKLQAKIEGLQDELLTKEQLSAKDKEKLKREREESEKRLAGERDSWKDRFHRSEISRAITDAAMDQGAFHTEDIAALLRPSANLAPVLDDQGNDTGNFVPKVKFSDKDKEGKPVTLDLTVAEAVKRMKETPERYGHLFKSTANSGLGMDGGTRGGKNVDVTKMTHAQYREYRKTQNRSRT